MKIHKYNNEYATKNGIDSDRETLIAIMVGVLGLIIPAMLLGIGIIKFIPALIIWVIVIFVLIYLIKRAGTITQSSMSVLIEDEDGLYYMTITPNLRGTGALGAYRGAFVVNKYKAELFAAKMAQDDKIITTLFDSYQKGKTGSTTFDTIMYRKPIYVYKILDKDFKAGHKKFYRVNCVKDNGKKTTIKIPNVYPTFFK